MEADGVKLTDDEVRERFSAFHDGELSADEAAFIRKRIDEEPALAREYESFCALLRGLAGMGSDAEEAMKPGERFAGEPPDLLPAIQQRLYKRSAGKFYRSRFSRRAGIMPLELIALVVLLILGIVYFSMTYISGLRPANPTPPSSHAPATQP